MCETLPALSQRESDTDKQTEIDRDSTSTQQERSFDSGF